MGSGTRLDTRLDEMEKPKARRDKRSGFTLMELADIERFRPLSDDETAARKRLIDREMRRRWREADPQTWRAVIDRKNRRREARHPAP